MRRGTNFSLVSCHSFARWFLGSRFVEGFSFCISFAFVCAYSLIMGVQVGSEAGETVEIGFGVGGLSTCRVRLIVWPGLVSVLFSFLICVMALFVL